MKLVKGNKDSHFGIKLMRVPDMAEVDPNDGSSIVYLGPGEFYRCPKKKIPKSIYMAWNSANYSDYITQLSDTEGADIGELLDQFKPTLLRVELINYYYLGECKIGIDELFPPTETESWGLPLMPELQACLIKDNLVGYEFISFEPIRVSDYYKRVNIPSTLKTYEYDWDCYELFPPVAQKTFIQDTCCVNDRKFEKRFKPYTVNPEGIVYDLYWSSTSEDLTEIKEENKITLGDLESKGLSFVATNNGRIYLKPCNYVWSSQEVVSDVAWESDTSGEISVKIPKINFNPTPTGTLFIVPTYKDNVLPALRVVFERYNINEFLTNNISPDSCGGEPCKYVPALYDTLEDAIAADPCFYIKTECVDNC